jgi:hypothetical protein
MVPFSVLDLSNITQGNTAADFRHGFHGSTWMMSNQSS